MVAQDTGSAIVGPARADLYFGAGLEAGRVSGRLKHGARFVMLVPKSLDPVAAGRHMILPDARPSAKIAKLFPPAKLAPKEGVKEPVKETPKEPAKAADPKGEAKPPSAAVAAAPSPPPAVVPLPLARPDVSPQQRTKYRRYRR
jgi:membrane-bound lytic murein transglycosylase A